MFTRILVPTDGSTEGERALDYAIELARIHGATIHAIYVVNVSSYGGIPMESAWDGISEALYDEGSDAVERVEELTPDDVAVETSILEGSPSRVIVDIASPESYDLIVMGTHGRGGLDRLLLGSVTERVVRNATVPVMTVRVSGDSSEQVAAESDAQAAIE